MRNKISATVLFVGVLFSSHSVFAEATHSKTSAVNSAGTTTEVEVVTEKSHTITGDPKVIHKEAVVVDPKGLGNKTAASKVQEEVRRDNGDYRVKEKIQRADGTYVEQDSSKTTAKHWTNSGVTVTEKDSTTVDPKGLGNKSTTETVIDTTKNPDGSIARKETKTVNGEVVSEVESPKK